MEHDYNFLADLLTTYRSNPDWLKFFWLFIPAALMTLCGHGLSRWIIFALGGGGERGARHRQDVPNPFPELTERPNESEALPPPSDTPRLPQVHDVDRDQSRPRKDDD